MTFGCQQTVDGFKVTSLGEVTGGVCKERREHKFLCIRHESRFWKLHRSKIKHLLSDSGSSGFVTSLLLVRHGVDACLYLAHHFLA